MQVTSFNRWLAVTLVVLIIACVVVLISQAKPVKIPTNQIGQNSSAAQEAADKIIAQVREVYAIPADVEPTVATIMDVEILRQQDPLYKKAENGDYLIVTPERAILFDPENKVILDVVPVQIRQAASSSSAKASSSASAKK